MKIYNSTEYIENPIVGDLKLEVNSQWDFSSRSVCFKTLSSGTLISYDIKKCIEVKDSFVVGSNQPKSCKQTKWEQAEINKHIVNNLIDKGYTISRDFKELIYGN